MSFSTYAQGNKGKNKLPGVALFQSNPQAFAAAKYDGYYFVNLSFDQIPNAQQQAVLAQEGIQLLSFQSGKTFRAAISVNKKNTDLGALGIHNITTIPATSKYNPILLEETIPVHAQRANEKVAMAIIFNDNISNKNIQEVLLDFDVQNIENTHRNGKTIIAEVDLDQLAALSNHPAIHFVDLLQEPVSMLNHEVKTHQNINILNSILPGGF